MLGSRTQRLEDGGQVSEQKLRDLVEHQQLEPPLRLALPARARQTERRAGVLQRFARLPAQWNQRLPGGRVL